MGTETQRNETIVQAIFEAIDDLNESFDLAQPVAKSPDTVIFGTGAQLESLALVTLLTAVEENIETRGLGQLSLLDLLPPDGRPVTVVSLAHRIAEVQTTAH